MYVDWRQGPIRLGIYGPAYYEWLGTIGRIADWSRTDMIFFGRRLSGLAFVIAVLLLVMLTMNGGNRRWSWAIPLLALGSLPVESAQFITSARPDTIAIALSLAGILLAMRDGRFSIAASAFMFAIAIFSKPTAIAAPVAVATVLFWERDRKRLLWLLGLLTAGMVGGVVALYVSTGGLFWLHQQVTLYAPHKWDYALFVLKKGVVRDQSRIIAVMVAIALLTRFVYPGFGELNDTLRRSWRWSTAYFIVAAFVAIFTSRRQGSNVNYLIEPILAGGWLLATWAQSLAATTSRSAMRLGRVLACIMLLNPMPLYIEPHVTSARNVATVTTLMGPNWREGEEWIRSQRQPLLCLDPWLAYRAGVEGYVNDPIAFGSMCLTRPDLDVLTARVKDRFFTSVVMNGPVEENGRYIHQDIRPRWPALKAALIENYVLEETLGQWHRYVPRAPRE